MTLRTDSRLQVKHRRESPPDTARDVSGDRSASPCFERQSLPEMVAMSTSSQAMAEQIAQAVATFQQEMTGRAPLSVSVVLGGETLVVTLQGALSLAEQALSQSPDGASKVQEFHRQLFLNASDTLRKEIKRITGFNVREASTEVEPKTGAVVQTFSSETMVQVFLLSGKVPAGGFPSDVTT
jgi:uncharacterized protein YbcI